jgi:epoxyqueuosine reductase
MAALKDDVIATALSVGFVAAGVTGMEPFHVARRRALDAVSSGRMDGMPWFNAERVEAAADLATRYPWGRSILALAWPYRPAIAPGTASAQPLGRGRMAAYACLEAEDGQTADYHDLLAERCDELVSELRRRDPELRVKRFVDHGWALDRAIAERAGIGFTGKHTQLISREAGSYVLLASLVLSLELEPDRPSSRSCGNCRACLPACPTGAIIAPGVIDARRCIAYLTIEHRGPIDAELRPLMGSWVFGCDLCQEACPINERLAPDPIELKPEPARGPVPFPELVDILLLTDADFEARFRGTSVWRTGRAGLARNAAIALGNSGTRGALPALQRAASDDPDGVVREAARWAIERITPHGAPVA